MAVIILFILISTLFLFFNYQIKNELEQTGQNIQYFGNFTKTFLFTYYYGLKYLQDFP